MQWLDDLLRDEGGQLDRRDVMKAAQAMGYKERTVHRAREKLNLVVDQTGFGKAKRSVWKFPDSAMPATCVPCVPDNLTGKHGIYGAEAGTHGLAVVPNDAEIF